MKVALGEAGLGKTWQDAFPKETRCCRCGGEARIAFVAHEGIDPDDRPRPRRRDFQFVCDLRKNGGKGDLWPHDCCAVAVYLCKGCLEPTALFNQG